MSAFPTYEIGTVSVAANGTVVTGDDVMWNNARPGDEISIDGLPFVKISDVTDLNHLTLIIPWGGGDKTDVPYVISQESPWRFVGGQQMSAVSELLATLNAKGLLWYLDPYWSEPSEARPPLTADDGQGILKIATGELWVMQGGAWTFAGTQRTWGEPTAWDDTTQFKVFDVVTHNGSTYFVYDEPPINTAPPNATYYTLLAAKGDVGATGVAATIAVGTVTTVAYGQPATVTNVGTSTAAEFDIEIPAGQDGTGTGDVQAANYASEYTGHGPAVRSNLGFSAVGESLAVAADSAAVRTAAGATTVGAAVLTATDAAAARVAIGAAVPQAINSQTFTSSGTFTTPAGSTTATVYRYRMVGGGGGGGGANASTAAAGGGGGGAYAEGTFTGVAASTGITITVGAAGSGGSAGATGTAGGSSSIGSPVSVTAGGGAPGVGTSSSVSLGALAARSRPERRTSFRCRVRRASPELCRLAERRLSVAAMALTHRSDTPACLATTMLAGADRLLSVTAPAEAAHSQVGASEGAADPAS